MTLFREINGRTVRVALLLEPGVPSSPHQRVKEDLEGHCLLSTTDSPFRSRR